MSETIKKYPIYYKNKEYEIRIEEERFDEWFYNTCINIYEVNTYTSYLLGCPIRDKRKYKKVYSKNLNYLKQRLSIGKNSDDYYVELFKLAFKKYIEPIETEERQLAALENWNGVIKL